MVCDHVKLNSVAAMKEYRHEEKREAARSVGLVIVVLSAIRSKEPITGGRNCSSTINQNDTKKFHRFLMINIACCLVSISNPKNVGFVTCPCKIRHLRICKEKGEIMKR